MPYEQNTKGFRLKNLVVNHQISQGSRAGILVKEYQTNGSFKVVLSALLSSLHGVLTKTEGRPRI